MYLMCKNKVVYDIESEQVINQALLPGYMREKGANAHTFVRWMKYRYSSGTNTLARQLKGVTFGQGARMRIDRETRALSFSDCYWIKAEDDPILFEEISPYFRPFWDGSQAFAGQAAPTLYVGGALSKEWKQDGKLYKYGDLTIELECIDLCKKCGIPVENASPLEGGIAIENITSPSFMLEQADQSGRLDPDDFDETTIIELFGQAGAAMLLIDAIIGNGDRHAGNFGWLRDADTGDYLGMAPLYDFDHALDTTLDTDRLLTDAIEACRPFPELTRKIAEQACQCSNPVFRKRAQKILENV